MQMLEIWEPVSQNKNITLSLSQEINDSRSQIWNHSLSAQNANLKKEEKISKDAKKSWTTQEVNLLENLYYKHGPAWSDFKKKFVNKTANDLKNKVNNSIRRISGLLDTKGFNRITCRSDTSHKIQSMLNMCFQIDKHMKKIHVTPNPESMLQSFKGKLLRLCFSQQPLEEDIQGLLKMIRHLNSRLKCFGIFKAKNQKNWKLSLQSFQAILQFDKPFLDKDSEVESKKSSRDSSNAFKGSIQTDFNRNTPTLESEADCLTLDQDFYLSQQKKHESISLEKQYCEIAGLEFEPSYAVFPDFNDFYGI